MPAGGCFSFDIHLQSICGGQSITDYLLLKYRAVYMQARPAMQGHSSCKPAGVRSEDVTMGHDAQLRKELIASLAGRRQRELIHRLSMVEAALIYYTRTEKFWMHGMGDTAFRRMTVAMSHVGALGRGEGLHTM